MDNSERIYEICLGGIGGQGVMLMAKIMGEALSNDGYNVLQTQAHGIEARGGISYGEVLYGHGEINRLCVTKPDILLALSESALSAYAGKVPENGYIFYDTYMIKDKYRDNLHKIYGAPFTEIAIKELGSAIYANLIAMGFINGITKIINPVILQGALQVCVKSNKKNNCKALQRGYEEVKKYNAE
jgi:2-oxoglutarate ferredoxin oxidoreductase subunit gamma